MIKDNQRHFNRLHVVIDAFIIAAAYILAWAIQFEMLGGISGFLFQHYMSMLPFLIPLYLDEGKYHLVVGIGCTGGRHRSVTMANAIYRRLKDLPYSVRMEHRDVNRDTRRKES